MWGFTWGAAATCTAPAVSTAVTASGDVEARLAFSDNGAASWSSVALPLGIDTLRAAFWRFESFELGFVANQLLGRKKLIEDPASKIEEIRRLFREGFQQVQCFGVVPSDKMAHSVNDRPDGGLL